MTLKNSILFLFSILPFCAIAQDAQLSQYYNAPLYLNPALAGAGLDTRVGTNYRMQWPNLTQPYKTYSIWADHDFYKKKSGVGFLIQRDEQGNNKISHTNISLLYAYQINISHTWTLKPAIQAGVGLKDINYNNAIFGDQLNNTGITGSSSTDPILNERNSKIYPDFSSGLVAYNSNLWIGLSANHINRPNQSFYINKSALPIKWSLIGGYKFVLLQRQIAWGAPVKETSITPTFLYKSQGISDQLDIGMYWIHNPIMAGLWYRGLPVKNYNKGVRNSESLVMMVGLNNNGLTIGYSYDILLSSLSTLAGGAHEISLIYQFQTDKSNQKDKKGHRPMPCPNVDRQFKKTKF